MQIMRLETGVSFWICRISVSGSPFSVPRSPFLSPNNSQLSKFRTVWD